MSSTDLFNLLRQKFIHWFPQVESRCILCQLYMAGTHHVVCQNCLNDLPYRGDTVLLHELPIQVAYAYRWPIDRFIHLYKYQERLDLSPVLYKGILCLDRPDVDALLAVPSSASRLRERGFNQSQELAKCLAMHWQIPLLNGVTRRAGHRQQGLSRSERLHNLENAFTLDATAQRPFPVRIALVDDVLTTGSTLLSLAAFLRQHGAIDVSALVVASNQQQRIRIE